MTFLRHPTQIITLDNIFKCELLIASDLHLRMNESVHIYVSPVDDQTAKIKTTTGKNYLSGLPSL